MVGQSPKFRHLLAGEVLLRGHAKLLDAFIKRYWDYYKSLPRYRDSPTDALAETLRKEFDELLSTHTGYAVLDERIAKTAAKKDGLLTVLSVPSVPLHNNASKLLGVSAYAYLLDRISRRFEFPSLASPFRPLLLAVEKIPSGIVQTTINSHNKVTPHFDINRDISRKINRMKLQGKRALITGGTKGIGAAIALDLAKSGVHVAFNGRTHDAAADALLSKVATLESKCEFIAADMADEDEVERFVTEAQAVLGGIDILVHAAGGPAPGTIEEVSPAQWREAFAVHLDAAYHLCRHALPHMRKNNEGAIVLISSAAGIRGCPGAIAYGTVKGAILQFTKALARDLCDDNIRVNCVAPGIIRTRFHDAMTAEQRQHNLANRLPLHREGTVADVATAVHFLVTNEFMTGETVVVDGGMSMQMVR